MQMLMQHATGVVVVGDFGYAETQPSHGTRLGLTLGLTPDSASHLAGRKHPVPRCRRSNLMRPIWTCCISQNVALAVHACTFNF